MTKQNALDELEAAVLDDIFGGHTAEAMSVRIGLLNINLTGKAQKNHQRNGSVPYSDS